MVNEKVFFELCKQALNKHKLNLTSIRKAILGAIYSFGENATPMSILEHIATNKNIMVTVDVIEEILEVLSSENVLSNIAENPKKTEEAVEAVPNVLGKIESNIVHLLKIYKNNTNAIIDTLEKKFSDINEAYVMQYIDAYKLLLNSQKVDPQIKELLQKPFFIENNASLALDLAKLFFLTDSVRLEEGKVVALKEVYFSSNTPQVNYKKEDEPEIDEQEVIRKVLQKIKYDRLTEKDISKINALSEYPTHKQLHRLLIKAIDSKTLIKQMNDNEFIINEAALEEILEQR